MNKILGNGVPKIADNGETEQKKPLAILVSCSSDEYDEMGTDASLDELEELIKTAGAIPFCRIVQSREKPDNATYIGSGKLNELAYLCSQNDVELVCFDAELSPAQISNIEAHLENARVIDRTMLILDIFAQRAKSSEGILQVEIAELKYTLPRLIGKGKDLSRLGGGIGTRGPGETKLEQDRRIVKKRIQKLEDELEAIAKNRKTQRKMREKNSIPQICLAGYTNAGKSTLINALCNDDIFAEDMLFATLDPTTRRLKLERSGECLLTDTVGFINRLPHHLVEAFRSTLEEVVYSDLILVVMDASDPKFMQKFEITKSIISSLFEKNSMPIGRMLYVLNKSDKEESRFNIMGFEDECVVISAKSKTGLNELISKIEDILSENKKKVKLALPYSMSSNVDMLYKNAKIESIEYKEDTIEIIASLKQKEYNLLCKYIID